MVNFETNLKAVLVEANLDNYAELGRQVSKSRQTIYQYANGERMPTLVERQSILTYINSKGVKQYTLDEVWPNLRSMKGRYHG
jgi:hypothetical protein